MSTFLSGLHPAKRRFVVGVAMLFFLMANVFWVWPRFSDWGNLKDRLETARQKFVNYETAMSQADKLKPELEKLKAGGGDVLPEDQALQYMRTIQEQAQRSGVVIISFGPQSISTNNPFFKELTQTVRFTSGEKQLVDFLYNLAADSSMVRARSLSVQPDGLRQQLSGDITLTASYQKTPKPQTAAPATKPPAAAKPGTPPLTRPQTSGPPAKPVVLPAPNKK